MGVQPDFDIIDELSNLIDRWKWLGVFNGHFVYDFNVVGKEWTLEELTEYEIACTIKDFKR